MTNTSYEVRVGTWTLHATDSGASAETMLLGARGMTESAFNPDKRKVVSTEHLSTGGKYRSIVKLQMRYEFQRSDDGRWAMGTGWLIRPDLLVTAGHCVYDWGDSLGRVVQVKAWIGYQGQGSVETPNVEFRHGKGIAVPAGWLSSPNARNCDVGFVKLDAPFKEVEPFTFDNTPVKGSLKLGIVGYPADQSSNGERGAKMYEEFADVQFDIAMSRDHMIEYCISSYAGQSGSPVFRSGMPLVPIGTHAYGVDGPDRLNKGSPIGGIYGNPYAAIIATFDKEYPIIQNKRGIQYREVPYALPFNVTNPPPPGVASLGTPFHDMPYSARPIAIGGHESAIGGDAEGFFAVVRSIVKIGGPILQTGISIATPFLGPVGAPISALAGTILSAASKACESALNGEPESDLGVDTHNTQAHASRAILAEAALQAVLSNPDRAEELGMFDTMKDVYNKMMPGVKKLAPKLLPIVMEPALRIALDALAKSRNGNDPERNVPLGEPVQLPPGGGKAESEMPLDPQTQSFFDKLTGPTRPVPGEERFFGNLGDVCRIGLGIAKPLIVTVGTGLSTISGALPENYMEPTLIETHLLGLAQRHVMGEAALQAIIKAHPKLDESESFFGDMKTTMQKIGRTILQAAPSVLATAVPILKTLIGSYVGSPGTYSGGTESSFRDGSVQSSYKNKRPSALKSRRSVADLIGVQAPPPAPYQPGASYLQYDEGLLSSRCDTATTGPASLISI